MAWMAPPSTQLREQAALWPSTTSPSPSPVKVTSQRVPNSSCAPHLHPATSRRPPPLSTAPPASNPNSKSNPKPNSNTNLKVFSRVRVFATPWAVAHQAPRFMEFSRQEYWSGLPFPSPGDLLDPRIKPGSPALQAVAELSEPPGKL